MLTLSDCLPLSLRIARSLCCWKRFGCRPAIELSVRTRCRALYVASARSLRPCRARSLDFVDYASYSPACASLRDSRLRSPYG
jgi:hypothetical protein